RYRTTRQRFEIDGADLARDFVLAHGRDDADARAVWLAIALHTTPEVPVRLEPEIALVAAGVQTDVTGSGLDEIGRDELDAVTRAHPRPNFKHEILRAFTDGMKDRPETTFGTVNEAVLAHFLPGFVGRDLVEVILNSPWPE
ncbi:MAG TPA: diguanylate cyclase, partial [Streptosporangiales bacterium]